ncbi:unnamed protein product [Cylicocyclus nassatus]|uniref:DUF1758 domain-containing protein n=1 Tax=Cylicocyclus nassatus TaxID=53992 RepID=A0AA36DL53_CYLNA|nr:unnamed protein product [Cylicocyclus nassatus]
MASEFNMKSCKQRLTRQLNELASLIVEANTFKEPWQFPINVEEIHRFTLANRAIIKNLTNQMKEKEDQIMTEYSNQARALETFKLNNTTYGESLEKEFDSYWENRKADESLDISVSTRRKLEVRIVELECQEQAVNITSSEVASSRPPIQETNKRCTLLFQAMEERNQGRDLNQTHAQNNQTTATTTSNRDHPQPWRYPYGHELRVPDFYGKPAEFESFWELFQELVHNQPYSDLEKLSILLACCKGDAERTLRMIPRSAKSYELAIQQLRAQYQDERRNKTLLLRKLQTLPRVGDDPRQLQNTYNDILTLVTEMRRQGEAVDSTNLLQTVTNKFPKSVQEEAAKREYDLNKIWTMAELLDNLDVIVKRRIHISFIQGRDSETSESSTFHIQTKSTTVNCTGCGGLHRFVDCVRYRTRKEKLNRLWQLNACLICFSKRHQAHVCNKPKCQYCNGNHHSLLCYKNNTFRIWREDVTRRSRSPVPASFRKFQNDRLSQQNHFVSRTSRSPIFKQNRSPRRQFTSPSRRYRDNYQMRSRSASPARKTNYEGISTLPTTYRNRSRSSSRSSHNSPTRTSPQKRVTFINYASTAEDVSAQKPTVVETFSKTTAKASPNAIHEDKIISTPAFSISDCPSCTRLMTVPVYVRNTQSGKLENLTALLDSASDSSFITTEVTRKLNLPSLSEQTIVVSTFGGHVERKKTTVVKTALVNSYGETLNVSLLTQDHITDKLKFCDLTMEDLAFIRRQLLIDNTKLKIDHDATQPSILLGIDYFNEIFIANQPPVRLPSGFYLSLTFFGYTISGKHSHAGPGAYNEKCTLFSQTENNFDYPNSYSLESMGITNSLSEQEETEKIIDNFYKTIEIHDKKIYVRLPWKANKDKLANNYKLALSRLHQQYKLAHKNPKLWEEYCKLIRDQFNNGIIEKAKGGNSAASPLYYIPHQAEFHGNQKPIIFCYNQNCIITLAQQNV